MKRFADIAVAATLLLALAPLLATIAFAIWLADRRSPFYRGLRVARGGGRFRMLKFRTMRVDAWKSGVNSTASGDARITPIGRLLRRTKLDELPQLWNVLLGDMSLVGPRPQVETDAAMYTSAERRMLVARPGITDLASIVFADEGAILMGSPDPDLLYNQIIRPWKSRLALLWIERRTLTADLRIICLTAIALFSRPHALAGVARILESWNADPELLAVARRDHRLTAAPPPGASEIVQEYARATTA
jgi:lipopolysaccharide/colanic/teichoic acid biosynthesis glycosyltransferase